MAPANPTSFWSRSTVLAAVQVVVVIASGAVALATAEQQSTLRLAMGFTALAFIGLAILLGPAATAPDENVEDTASDLWLAGTSQTLIYAVWIVGVLLFTNALLADTLSSKTSPFVDPTNPYELTLRWRAYSLLWQPLILLVVFICSLPGLVMMIAARIIRRFRSVEQYRLLPSDERQGKSGRSENIWKYEQQRATASYARINQHALLMGVFVSLTLMVCAKIVWTVSGDHAVLRPDTSLLSGAAVAVAAAACFAFTVGTIGIFVRAAQDDASARMFARAGHEVLIAELTTVIAVPLLKEVIHGSTSSAVLLGFACAILGRTAYAAMRERAARFLGIQEVPRTSIDYAMTLIEGITDEEIARLGEEGIDNLHALAVAPTARIFFATRFSLPRICDWQDQALLIQFFGPSTAGKFKEHYRVRGVLDAQMIAHTVLGLPTDDIVKGNDASAKARVELYKRLATIFAPDANDASKPGPGLDALVKDLGFRDLNQTKVALATLISDETVERLRAFWRAAVATEADEDDATPCDSKAGTATSLAPPSPRQPAPTNPPPAGGA